MDNRRLATDDPDVDPYRLKAQKSVGDPRVEALNAIEERIRERRAVMLPDAPKEQSEWVPAEPEEREGYLPMRNTLAWLDVARELDVTRYQLGEIVNAAGTRHIETIRSFVSRERALGMHSRW